MSNQVQFFLNGDFITIDNPDPHLLLIDYLRSPEIGLIGAKKGCGQGGCGACTVIMSQWNPKHKKAEHISINSCLRPVCSLGGLSITTVEGTGGVGQTKPQHMNFAPSFSRGGGHLSKTQPSREWLKVASELKKFRKEKVKKALESANFHQQNALSEVKSDVMKHKQKHKDEHEGMNPVAHAMAVNNGTQCGYCTVGFVMNMSAFLSANSNPTKKEIEDIFDGNICRCTGYRAIMTGMKTFASDLTESDIANRMRCVTEEKCNEVLVHNHIKIPFPKSAQIQPIASTIKVNGKLWYTPENVEALIQLYNLHEGKVRMIFGNTSYGIYAKEIEAENVFVDLKMISELYGIEECENEIIVGALTTYSKFLEFMKEKLAEENSETSRWLALDFMGRRTAGMIVRNAASLSGNTMLVLKHIFNDDPFPSDLLTALDATQSSIEYLELDTGSAKRSTVKELVNLVLSDKAYVDKILILRYFLPKAEKDEVTLAQKVALRQVNSHSIVNSTSRYEFSSKLKIIKSDLVFGGIAPFPWHAEKTETLLNGEVLSLNLFQKAVSTLRKESKAQLQKWEKRMAAIYTEGFTEAYKIDLVVGLFYKSIVNALLHKAPKKLPANVRSIGEIKWGNWPVTKGTQHYKTQSWKSPVSEPIIKLMAFHQAMGQVHYTHEIELPVMGKNAAFVQSQRALALFKYLIPGQKKKASTDEIRLHLAKKFISFYEFLNHEDIPLGGHNRQGMGADQPLFAVKEVSYVGQVMSMIIAETEQEAIKIAAYVSDYCIDYSQIKLSPKWDNAWKKPIITIDEAIKMGSIYPDAPESAAFVSHIWKITRPGTELSWVNQKRKALDKAPNRRLDYLDNNEVFVIENTQVSGCQIHFYMETQSCVAYPEDGDRLVLHPSSQSPSAMHQTSAMAIGSELNKVEVAIRQLGGGYGGKTEQARFIAGPTAVAAKVLNIPIRLVMKRESDTAMIGKRHGYYGTYQIAVDNGKNNSENKGLIRGFQIKLWGDGGAFYDCSFIVSNCIQLRIDNAYNIKNFESQLDVCRTNTAPNTAMRAFGDIQGKVIMENAIDDAAYSVNMDPYQLRLKNMYRQGDVTPFGQNLAYCYMRDVWEYCKKVSQYDKKVADVKAFNNKNKWVKRGVYMVPVKYGSGYNLVMIEQATAMVSIYSGDGSIIINQGAVDMGQGAITQIEQVASYILNVPMDMIQVLSARTSVIPNPTSTGGSTGTAYNGEAVKQACEVMRKRLLEFGYLLRAENGDQWCTDSGVDFWNHDKGWFSKVTKKGAKHSALIWQNLIALAYQNRISLVSTFNAKIKGGTVPVPVMTFKPASEQPKIPFIKNSNVETISGEVDSFNGFTFSASCALIEMDIITGETKIISADLVYDMGWSLNPAIDIGQVEGAFIQGVGYLMTEKLVLEPNGDEKGRLNTLNTWRYKPPAITTIPLELNTFLYPRDESSSVPENPNGILSSKEVGEPPLVLATSVFFAMKDAIRESRLERGLGGIFKFDAPATVQEVRLALDLKDDDLIA